MMRLASLLFCILYCLGCAPAARLDAPLERKIDWDSHREGQPNDEGVFPSADIDRGIAVLARIEDIATSGSATAADWKRAARWLRSTAQPLAGIGAANLSEPNVSMLLARNAALLDRCEAYWGADRDASTAKVLGSIVESCQAIAAYPDTGIEFGESIHANLDTGFVCGNVIDTVDFEREMILFRADRAKGNLERARQHLASAITLARDVGVLDEVDLDQLEQFRSTLR